MAYIQKNHPVRFLIESAANGRKLTAGDLEMLKRTDAALPAGESLTSYAAKINAAAGRVAGIGATGHRAAAMEQAEREWEDLAGSMTEEQAALTGATTPDDNKEISNMVSELFNN